MTQTVAAVSEIASRGYAQPDVLVVLGDDQHEQFGDDNMPIFALFNGQEMPVVKRGSRGPRDADPAFTDKPSSFSSWGPPQPSSEPGTPPGNRTRARGRCG